MNYSIKLKLKDKPSKEGLYPIILSIIKDRKVKVISLGIKCKKVDWDDSAAELKRSFTNFAQANRILLQKKQEALKIVYDFELEGIDFTLSQFEERFRGRKDKNVTIKSFLEEKIADLNLAGRAGNARAYKDTMNSFFKFAKNDKLMFRELNVEMLDKYETYLRSKGSKDGGIGVRMRELRALFNDAIKKGIVNEKYYPFKNYKVSKLKGKGLKRALTHAEIRLVEEFDEVKYPQLAHSKKMFMFSYYTRGMNFYDMMKLTWDNIQGNYIVYTRSKTKVNFRIEILPPVKNILDYYRVRRSITNYVFPILLQRELTAVQIENRKAKKLKQFNRDLKKIAEIQGIQSTVTSYVARHSYATILRYLGGSTEAISQSMGHSNVSITTTYLKEFEHGDIDLVNRKLLQEPIPIYYTNINQWPTSA